MSAATVRPKSAGAPRAKSPAKSTPSSGLPCPRPADPNRNYLQGLIRSVYVDGLEHLDKATGDSSVDTLCLELLTDPTRFIGEWIRNARKLQTAEQVPAEEFYDLLIAAIDARKEIRRESGETRTKSPYWRASYLHGVFSELKKKKATRNYEKSFHVFMTWLINKHKVPVSLAPDIRDYFFDSKIKKLKLKEALEYARNGGLDPPADVIQSMFFVLKDPYLKQRYQDGGDMKRIALLAMRASMLDQHKRYSEKLMSWIVPTKKLGDFLFALGSTEWAQRFDQETGGTWLIISVFDRLKHRNKLRDASRRRPGAKRRKKPGSST
jgi:hypothetical protein